MHHTFKGIYTKFRGDNGRISNVLYENIYIEVMVLIIVGSAEQQNLDRAKSAASSQKIQQMKKYGLTDTIQSS